MKITVLQEMVGVVSGLCTSISKGYAKLATKQVRKAENQLRVMIRNRDFVTD